MSTDIIENSHLCIIDELGTTVIGGVGNFVKALGWYDNEWGYTCRLIDVVKHIAFMLCLVKVHQSVDITYC